MKLMLIFALFFVGVVSARKSYSGYQVLQIKSQSEKHVRWLNKLESDNRVTILSHVSIGKSSMLLVPPQHVKEVYNVLMKLNLKIKRITMDAGIHLKKTFERLDSKKVFDLNDFNSFEDILTGLDQFVSNCPSGASCVLENIGVSFENRPLRLLKLTKSGTNRPIIWMDSTIHAREWLSSATLLNVVDRMIKQENADAVSLLNNYDFYFLVVMNPDGYVYSFDEDRFWRKNRRPNEGSFCVGTDLNRNYDASWGTDGTSTNPCADTYGGPSAASEPETQAVQNYGSTVASRVKLWTTMHTFGQYILTPYGHTEDGFNCALPPDYDDILSAADAFANAIELTYDTFWERGSTCTVLYEASGSTCDWAYSKGVKYSFTPELRGDFFDPPASEIQPSFNEFWNGLVAVVKKIEEIEK